MDSRQRQKNLLVARNHRLKRLRKLLRPAGEGKRDVETYAYFEPEIEIASEQATEPTKLRCTLCGEMIPLSNMAKHKLMEQNYLNTLHCVTCDVNFTKKSAFRIHIYEQHKIYHCKVCSKVFNKRQLYRTHNEMLHGVKAKVRVECEICGRLFANKKIVKRHTAEVHYGQREPEAKCPQCDYRSYNRSNLKVHIDKHNNTPAFVCDLCGMGCFTKTSLNDHAANAHGQGFKCPTCNKCYRNDSSLKSHMKTHDPGFDPATVRQQCEHCGEFFNHKSSLNKHLLRHLGLGKTFDCDVCGKKVASKGSYRSHMAIHSGFKPWACEYCDKRFADRQYLTQHRRIHTGEKPFKCDECGQCFNQRSSLSRHKRYHSAGRIGR